tara:strand:+ start:1265 stop:1465 length:201 start_codon:yes stop_codon:yes gene_type:complete
MKTITIGQKVVSTIADCIETGEIIAGFLVDANIQDGIATVMLSQLDDNGDAQHVQVPLDTLIYIDY